MIEEQRNAFRQVIGYMRAEKPDAVLIAGDIYDRAVPGVDAVRVFDDLLTDLAHEGADVLLIAGNHDSPERLNYASRLLSGMKLHICGAFTGAIKVVSLDDEFGKVNFFLLPFIKPPTVRAYFSDREIDTYGDALKAVLDGATINPAERNVLIAHQFFTKAGVSAERSDSEINIIGGIDEIDAEPLSPFNYVALGHLHGTQRVGAEHIRYAGSPLKYSFSECEQNKCVLLVDLDGKGNAAVKPLPITPLHDLRRIKGTLDGLLNADEAQTGNKEDYLRIILTDEDEIIDPMNKLRGVYPNAMVLDFENSRTSVDLGAVTADADTVERLSEYDLFCQFFADVTGGTMTDGQSEIIRDLLDGEEAQ
jgi:exonuclease SbcD